MKNASGVSGNLNWLENETGAIAHRTDEARRDLALDSLSDRKDTFLTFAPGAYTGFVHDRLSH
jgi:hypothetical protein